MAISKNWAGRIYGTNTGNIYVVLEGDDAALTGKAHLNDDQLGVVVYSLSGTFDGSKLAISGEPVQPPPDGASFGKISAEAKLSPRGALEGEWASENGTAGLITLHAHDRSDPPAMPEGERPVQLHTARHTFGAVVFDRVEVVELAEEIQREFKTAEVVVSVVAPTEQSRLLKDFAKFRFLANRATFLKLYVQEAEANGINRVVTVEFGPQTNFVIVQSSDEAWALGMCEKIKQRVAPYSRFNAATVRFAGIGINQLILLGAIAFLPSLPTLLSRMAFMVGVVGLSYAMDWAHRRYLPLALIYVGERSESWLARNLSRAGSWILAILTSVLTTLLGAFLKNMVIGP